MPAWFLFTANFLFATLASAVIVYQVSRSFLVSGAPGMLLRICGAIFYGLSGFAALWVHKDANQAVTIHNVCLWLAGLCHLAGVMCSDRWRSVRPAAGWLLAGRVGNAPTDASFLLFWLSAPLGVAQR